MRIHIQSIDWKIWGMIEDGYTSPTIVVDGKKVPKSWSEWDERDFSFDNLNFKAISCIINRLSCNEFHKVMNITCVKMMWNYLEVTHEGTNKIKNSKINMLTQILNLFDCRLTSLLMNFLIGSKASLIISKLL